MTFPSLSLSPGSTPPLELRRVKIKDYRYFLFFALLLLFALLQGGRIPYLLLYFVGGLEVLSLLWTRGVLRSLSASVEANQRSLVAGRSLQLKLRLYNEGFWPVPWVKVTMVPALLGNQPELPASFSGLFPLGPLASRVALLETGPLRRGLYSLGPFQITFGDPWGLSRGQLTVHGSGEILVLPRILPLNQLPLEKGRPFGRQRRVGLAWEDPSNLRDLHPYRPGDNPKRVHWPTSARLGQLYIREFDLTSSPNLLIFLDLYRGSYSHLAEEEAARLEDTAVEVAVAVARYAYATRQDFGFFAAGNRSFRLPVDKAARNFPLLVRALVEAKAQGQLPLFQLLTPGSFPRQGQQSVVIITPQLTGELRIVLNSLSRRGQSGIVFLIQSPAPDEVTSPPSAGPTRLDHFPVYVIGEAEDLLHLS